MWSLGAPMRHGALQGPMWSFNLCWKTVAKRKFRLPSGNPLGKNVVSIAQNCSETQISFSRGEPSREKRGVDRPKL